jgi:hypothetical protein
VRRVSPSGVILFSASSALRSSSSVAQKMRLVFLPLPGSTSTSYALNSLQAGEGALAALQLLANSGDHLVDRVRIAFELCQSCVHESHP